MRRFRISLPTICFGLLFVSSTTASDPHETLDDGTKNAGIKKDVILNVPMDVATVDLYTQSGKPSGIKIPLAASLGLSKNIASLNIVLAKEADWRKPHLSVHLAAMKQLTSLSYVTSVSYPSDRDIIGQCTSLKSLSLACDTLYDGVNPIPKALPFIEGLTRLESLTLALHNTLENCRHLQSLSKLPNLRVLDLLHHFNHTDTCGGTKCLEQLTQLSRLSLRISDPEGALEKIYPKALLDRENCMFRPIMPSLTHFKLTFERGDIDHQLQYLVPDSPVLEELGLIAHEHTAKLTGDSDKWLTHSKSLKALHLENIIFTDQVVELAKMPNLKTLQMKLPKGYVKHEEVIRTALKEMLPGCDFCFLWDESK